MRESPDCSGAGSGRLFSGESNASASTNTYADEQRYPARARGDACPDQSEAATFNRNPRLSWE
ncbi:MAG: hypothetical protein JWM17_2893 [Actinobacteria bacterium]|jgi:hypothetical protein|nr:hypothetical protein [Actinomycetota bacterium]MCW3045281.1 hypothetical protein [Actinomycetota bacterium]